MRYATWPRRAASILIDYGILIPLPLIAWFMSGWRTIAILYAIDVLLLVGNRWALAGYNGRTFGRTAMRIKLVAAKSHRPIGFMAALKRDLCHIVDSVALGIGWIRPLWNRAHQTIADSIVGSVVLPE